MKKLLWLGIVLLMVGCRVKQPVQQVPLLTKIESKVRFVPVKIADDSSSLKALFECDSARTVILKKMEELKGKNVVSEMTFDKGILNYKAAFKPAKDSIIVRDSLIYKEVAVEVQVPYKVNELYVWQKVLMWMGVVMLVIVIFKIAKYVSI